MSSTPAQSTSSAAARRFLEQFQAITVHLHLWANMHVHRPMRRYLDPEDVVQEAGVRALMNFDRFDAERGSFRAWVFGIATNVMLHKLREIRRGRGLAVSDGWPAQSTDHPDAHALIDSVSSITSQVAHREQLAATLQEIQGLGQQDRSLLMFRGLEQLEFAEVGARLGLSPDAARKRWRRLLQRLRDSQNLRRFLGEA